MGFLVLLPLVVVMAGGYLAWRWRRQARLEQSRDRARLKVIEGQLAMLRAALRISMAEHLARRYMTTDCQADVHSRPES